MAGLYFSVGADFQKLQQLKKDLDDLKSKLKGMDSAADKKAFEALNRQLQQAQREYDTLAGKLSRYVAEQNRASQATSSSANEMLSLFAKIGGTTALIGLGKQVMDVRNEFQQLEIAFGTMLKSTDKAAALMKDLTKFAAETPFGLQSAASGAKQLLAYGSTADTVIKELTMLGDVAAGTGQQIGDLVYLYGTLRTQGRAYLMDIRQFAGRGIPIYDELAKVLNTSKDKVNDLVSAGKVGFPEVERAFKNMTTQGGLYGGLMEQQSAAIGGRLEALKDNIDSIFNTIGKNNEGVIYKSIDGLNTLVENYETVGKILLGLVATYGTYKAALVVINTLEKTNATLMRQAVVEKNLAAMANVKLTSAEAYQIASKKMLTFHTANLTKALKAQMLAMVTNPAILMTAALVGLGWSVYKLATYESDLAKVHKEASRFQSELTTEIIKESAALDTLFGKLKETTAGTDERKKIVEQITSRYGEYLGKQNLETANLNQITIAQKEANAALEENIRLKKLNQESENIKNNLTQNIEKYTDKIDALVADVDNFGVEAGTRISVRLQQAIQEAIANGTTIDRDAFIENIKKDFDKTGDILSNGLIEDLEMSLYSNMQMINKELYNANAGLSLIEKKAKVTLEESQKLNKEANDVSKTPKAIQDQIFSATKKVQDLKNELKDLQKGIVPDISKNDAGFDFAKTIEEKTKELKEAEDKVSYLLYGKSSSSFDKETKAGESAAEKAHKQAQEIADQNEKIKQLVDKQALERKRQDEDLENQATQARINAMQSGAEKQRAQRDYDNKMEIQAIERQKEDSIRAYIQAERELFDQREELELKKNPKYTKKVFDPTSIKVDTTLFDSIVGDVSDSQLRKGFNEIDKAWNDYFLQFGNYQEKRKAIIDKYDKEIAEATTGGEKAILEKQRQNQLDELDNSVKNSTTLMGQLFADASRKSVNEIQAIIDKAELLMNYLEAAKDENGNALINGKTVSKQDILGLGISENTIKNLELSTQEVESLRNAISKLKDELGSKSPFKLFEKQISDAISKIKKGGKDNMLQGITDISSAIDQFSPKAKEFGDSLGTLFGDDKMSDNIGLVIDGIGGVGQAASGVAKIISGDVVGGIMDAVNGAAKAVSAFGTLFGPNGTAEYEGIKSQLEAINKIYESIIANSKEDIVFGGGFATINAASTALDNYNKKVINLQKIAAASGGAGAAWNSHSAAWHTNKNVGADNFMSMGKIIDKSVNSINDLYNLTGDELYLIQSQMPEAWDKIDGRIKENLQSIIDCKDEANELKDALNEALTGVSQDAFYNDFINNLSDMSISFEDMCDDFEGYLRKSIIAGLVADQYKDKISALYQSWSDAANSEGRITEDEAKKLKEEYKSIVEQMMKDREGLADSFGWDTSSGSSQSPSSGYSTSMSQDTGDKIVGIATGTQLRLITIDQNVARIAQWNQPIGDKFNFDSIAMPLGVLGQSSLRIERMIEENRNIAIQLFYVVRDIKKDTSFLPGIKEGIDSMNNKLDNL